MSVIHGENIRIYNASGQKLLAGAKSCLIHKQGDALEVASSTSGQDREFIAGRTQWSVDMAYLITTGLDGIPLVGTKYQIKVMVNGTQVKTGYVICTSCDVQATALNLATGSIKMQGTGSLE